MSLADGVNRFVSLFLADNEAHKEKYIHDPIWGGIELLPWEQCLVDTPLFQRLRQIHQTGCVFATFPSAHHTRFEHTLGVMQAAGRMSEELAKGGRIADPVQSRYKVRLAALTHDLGHSAFSHTSEEFYSDCSDIKTLIAPRGQFENKGAGEVLSYLIVTSTAFRDFFQRVKEKHPALKIDVDDFAPLILGKPSDPKGANLFEAWVISSPLDADKLDYFPRDGRAAGLEMSLDIGRLLNCIEVHEHEGKNVLAVHRGGFNPIQQLLFARATLFSSVYHHHKVRACDCMVKAVFEVLQDEGIQVPHSDELLKLNSAADFLFLNDLVFFADAFRRKPECLVRQLIEDVLYRRLLKRTLTISGNTIQGFREHPESVKASYSQFYNLRANRSALIKLRDRICKESGITCTKYRISIDVPSTPSFDKAGNALIRVSASDEKAKLERLSEFIPVKEWVSTYSQYYAQSFVFGPPSCNDRVKLAIATARVIKGEYGLGLKKDALPSDIRKQVIEADPEAFVLGK